ANLVISLNAPSPANSLIRDGVIIANQRLSCSKRRKEPMRCLKCHHWGHMAATCKSALDICGTCGQNHRTASCNNRNTLRCQSCQTEDHASWSRDCPAFTKRCDDLDAKFPENQMPYFPTDKLWT
ncbi:hypothetical protein OF83DRAFT_1030600, partial [Amylostereum chailletii]